MPKFFFPDRTPNGRSYHGSRKLKSGRFVFDQMPHEGIYTKAEYEAFRQYNGKAVPGVWRNVKRGQYAFIFGLRQFIGDTLPQITEAP